MISKSLLLLCAFLQISMAAGELELDPQQVQIRLRNAGSEETGTRSDVIEDVLTSKNTELVMTYLSSYGGGPDIIREIVKLDDSEFKDEVYLAFLENKWPLDLGGDGPPSGNITHYYELAISCIEYVNRRLRINIKPRNEENLKKFLSLKEREKYALQIRSQEIEGNKNALATPDGSVRHIEGGERARMIISAEEKSKVNKSRGFEVLYWILSLLIAGGLVLLAWNTRKGTSAR